MRSKPGSDALVAEIRRYPVKSMAGESLSTAEIHTRGVVGDRWYAVTDAGGKLASGKSSRLLRRRDEIFAFTATTMDDCVEVSSPLGVWDVGDDRLDQVLSAQMRAEVQIRAESRISHQDAAPVSIVGTASLAWCRERLGVDGDARRIRPNFVVRTSEPFEEEAWVGQRVRFGDAELAVVDRIARCRMVDIAQQGLEQQPGWLRGLSRERDLRLGIYAAVIQPGRVSVDAPVRVLGP